MGEFAFACPECGRSISASLNAAGTEIDCPKCFRKIQVPPAPASMDTDESAAVNGSPQFGKQQGVPWVAFVLVVIGALAMAILLFKEDLFLGGRVPAAQPTTINTNSVNTTSTNQPPPERVRYQVPTNILWTLSLAKAEIPQEPARGRIHGEGFKAERTTIQGEVLAMIQGAKWPGDLGFSVRLLGREPANLTNKTITIGRYRTNASTHVTLRWKNQEMQNIAQTFTNGYLLKLSFGEIVNKRIPGEIYLALPDADKSFIAGTFQAEIRPPAAPKKAPTPVLDQQ